MAVVRRRTAVGDRWIIDISFDHPTAGKRRVVEVAEIQTRKGAEAEERHIVAALLAGTYRSPRERRRKEASERNSKTEAESATPTVAQFSETFFEAATAGRVGLRKKKRRWKHSTMLAARSVMTHHVIPTIGTVRLDRVGPAHVEEVLMTMRTLSPKTTNNGLSLLACMLDFAVKLGHRTGVPEIEPLAYEKPEMQRITDEDGEAIRRAAECRGPVDLALALVLLDTGCRAGEVLGLQWSDISFKATPGAEHGNMTIVRARHRGVEGTTKSGRARYVPITGRLAAALREVRGVGAAYVFTSRDGKEPTTISGIKARVGSWERAAGLPITRKLHTFRHAFVTRLILAGVPVPTVQKLVGHSDFATTERYTHLLNEELGRGIALMEKASGTGTAGGSSR
jgi:integrase